MKLKELRSARQIPLTFVLCSLNFHWIAAVTSFLRDDGVIANEREAI